MRWRTLKIFGGPDDGLEFSLHPSHLVKLTGPKSNKAEVRGYVYEITNREQVGDVEVVHLKYLAAAKQPKSK